MIGIFLIWIYVPTYHDNLFSKKVNVVLWSSLALKCIFLLVSFSVCIENSYLYFSVEKISASKLFSLKFHSTKYTVRPENLKKFRQKKLLKQIFFFIFSNFWKKIFNFFFREIVGNSHYLHTFLKKSIILLYNNNLSACLPLLRISYGLKDRLTTFLVVDQNH